MAFQSESFNPYIEQLCIEVQACVAQEESKPSRKALKNWAALFVDAFSLGIDNVIVHQIRLLALAKVLDNASIRLPVLPKDTPNALTTSVLEAVAEENPEAAAFLINLRFILNVATKGLQKALMQYAADFLSPRVAGADYRVSLPAIRASSCIEFLSEETADQIAEDTPFEEYASARDAEIILMRSIRALNFESAQNYETQRILTSRIIIPWMRRLFINGDYSAALHLESLLFENFLRRQEEEQHYQESSRLWASMTEAAGLALRQRMGPPKPILRAGAKPVVGFFIHRASMLAHIQVLHTALSGIGDIADLPYRITIYVWSSYDAAMDKAFSALGVHLVWVARLYPLNLPHLDRLLGLRKQMEEDGVQVLVWMCVTQMKGFALGLGLAPRQVYWSAKYQIGAYDTPDDRIIWHDNAEDQVIVDGKAWRSVPLTFTPTQHTLDQQKLAELQEKFSKWKVILGTMAREDILNSAPFISMVARILKNNPDAVYFYTGRNNLASIESIFKNAGVENQAVFVGWVDTVVYANLVDIYLDSWPARSGLTFFNVFEAGKAFVSMILKEGGAIHTQFASVPIKYDGNGALHFGLEELDRDFDALDNGQRFFPIAGNEADYLRTAQRLIDDMNLRQKIGVISVKIAKNMSDPTRAGRKLDRILRLNLAAVSDPAVALGDFHRIADQ